MRSMRLLLAIPAILALAGCAGATVMPSPTEPAGPRVIEITASDDLKFTPATVSVKAGEAVIFRVKNTGAIVHEFMVGPSDQVNADGGDAAKELEDIEGGQSKDLPFTFGTTGTFSFACHVPGHFEAGMKGDVTLGS